MAVAKQSSRASVFATWSTGQRVKVATLRTMNHRPTNHQTTNRQIYLKATNHQTTTMRSSSMKHASAQLFWEERAGGNNALVMPCVCALNMPRSAALAGTARHGGARRARTSTDSRRTRARAAKRPSRRSAARANFAAVFTAQRRWARRCAQSRRSESVLRRGCSSSTRHGIRTLPWARSCAGTRLS